MTNSNIRIIIDSREKVHIRKVLSKAGIVYGVEAMKVGDYKAVTPSGTVTIERKTMSDLFSSIMDGRFETQMAKLSQENLPILLITGDFKELYRFYKSTARINEQTVHGIIASALVRYGLRSVIWIQAIDGDPHKDGLILAGKVLKKIAEGKLDQIPDRRIETKTKPQEELLKHILNIPKNVAINLLSKFGSVRGVLNAQDDQLKQVKGVGPARLKRMKTMLDEIT